MNEDTDFSSGYDSKLREQFMIGDTVQYEKRGVVLFSYVRGVRYRTGFITGIKTIVDGWISSDVCKVITKVDPTLDIKFRRTVFEDSFELEIAQGDSSTEVPMATGFSLKEELQGSVMWHKETFPGATRDEIERKLREELIELHEHSGDPSEMADVLIVMAALANRYGYDLATEVRKKMEVNRSRKRDELGNRLDKPKSNMFTTPPMEEIKRIPDYQIEKIQSKVENPLDILDEARALVNGDRREDYGPLTPSFQRIAKMWSGVFDIPVTPIQVALAMVLLKACRASQGYKRDSLVDMAGYTYILQKLQEELGESSNG